MEPIIQSQLDLTDLLAMVGSVGVLYKPQKLSAAFCNVLLSILHT